MAISRLESLKQIETQLLDELEKVRDLIRRYEPPVAQPAPVNTVQPAKNTHTANKKKERAPVKAEGVGRGTQTWEKYAQTVLAELGGQGKAQDVVAYGIKANPKEKATTVRHALRSKLSKLGRRGVIGARPGQYKKDGYTFFLKEGKESKTTSLFNVNNEAA